MTKSLTGSNLAFDPSICYPRDKLNVVFVKKNLVELISSKPKYLILCVRDCWDICTHDVLYRRE